MATFTSQRKPKVVFAEVLFDEAQDDFYIVLDLDDGHQLLCPDSFATKGSAEYYLHRNDHFLGRRTDSFDSGWSYWNYPAEAR